MSTSDFSQGKTTRVIPGDQVGASRSWFKENNRFSDQRESAEFVKTTFSGGRDNAQAGYEQAQQQGYEEGYQQGIESANSELQSLRNELESTLQLLQNPLDKVDAQVEHELLELSLEVARQILRREIKTDPRHLIGLIRDAVKQLPSSVEEINLHLNPQDATIIRQTLQKYKSDQTWHVTDDPSVPRGDCQLHASPSFVDVGIDAIVGQLAAELLGDDRLGNDSSESSA